MKFWAAIKKTSKSIFTCRNEISRLWGAVGKASCRTAWLPWKAKWYISIKLIPQIHKNKMWQDMHHIFPNVKDIKRQTNMHCRIIKIWVLEALKNYNAFTPIFKYPLNCKINISRYSLWWLLWSFWGKQQMSNSFLIHISSSLFPCMGRASLLGEPGLPWRRGRSHNWVLWASPLPRGRQQLEEGPALWGNNGTSQLRVEQG